MAVTVKQAWDGVELELEKGKGDVILRKEETHAENQTAGLQNHQ